MPDNIPSPVQQLSPEEAAGWIESGAIAIDVFGAHNARYDELSGQWFINKRRRSIPGAIWLPEVGRGTLQPIIENYLRRNLVKLTKGKATKPLVIFCVSDCWMSWNASQRIAALGYTQVGWFTLGVDGWEESGRELVLVDPQPIEID